MLGSRRQWRPASVGLILCALVVSGCASWRVPRIDPSGERLFVLDEAPAAPAVIGAPVAAVPMTPVATPDPVASGAGPIVYAPMPAAPAVAPAPVFVGDGRQLVLHPLTTVAPVGSEVVVLAGVVGPDQYLRTNQRIEWLLDPAGVGFFVDLNRRTFADWLVLDANFPKKISNIYAIGSTSRHTLQLTRGTANPADDVQVLAGQAWISVSSAVEGTSYVTAMSPCLGGWEGRKQVSVIHWIDGQWVFPPPAINPAGSRHTLTTTVMRQSNQTPCNGWLVRYQILDGPPAGFAPNGTPEIEVPTNGAGQACVEIFQKQPVAGTNRIGIQVIRPASTSGGRGQPLVIGSGSTMATWSAPGVAVRKRGPAVASLGATVTYQIEVSNSGDLAAEDVSVVDTLPQGLSLLSSNPTCQAAGGTLRWQLGRLGPAETRRLEVSCRADRLGSLSSCVEVTARGGLKGRDCATMNVSAASASPSLPTTGTPTPGSPTTAVSVQISGPDRADVGTEAKFYIDITNRGRVPLSGLLVKDHFDPGLRHAEAESPIEKELGTLAPSQSQRIGVSLLVTKPGRHCQTVEITDSRRNLLASAQACVTGVGTGSSAAQPKPSSPTPSQSKPAEPSSKPAPTPAAPSFPATPYSRPTPGASVPIPRPSNASKPSAKAATVTLKVRGPVARTVGETAEFGFEVANPGLEPLRNLKVVARLDQKLDPTQATDGSQWEGDAMVWTVDVLAPGKPVGYQIHARTVVPAEQACLQVTVRDDRGTLAQDQACVQIRPTPGTVRPSGLSLKVLDRHDPITIGKELTYDIEVVNTGTRAETNIILLVDVPPEMTPVRLQTTGPATYTIEGQLVRFSPVPQLDMGRTLTYRVRVLAKKDGVAFLRAQVTSQGLDQPIMGEQKTTVTK